MKPNHVLKSLLVASAFTQSAVALAAPTWSLTGSCTTSTGLGNTRTCTGGPSSVSVTAWSTTGAGSTYATAEVKGYAGGLGVRNSLESSISPDHSMDNQLPGGRDLLLLTFDSAVTLSELSLGYVSGDSDVSVLAFTGSGSTSIAGKSSAGLLGAGGWSLVSQVSGGSAAGTRTFNSSGSFSSSWWLISAYNSSFGGTALDSTGDYVKLLSVAGNLVAPPPSGGVPEPTSLALAGLAMAGIWGAKRRSRRAA